MSWLRIIRLLLGVAALGLLPACSAVRLAYNNAPDLVYWWVDGYADLDETQSLALREDLARLQHWHRDAELPKIADLLHQVQQLASADTSAQQMCTLYADIRLRLDALATQAEAGSAALAMALTAEQIAHIQSRFDKNNARWREEWIERDPADQHAHRLKGALERAEDFYGTLASHQRAVLSDAIARSGFEPQRVYAERLRNQQDLLQTLAQVSAGGTAPANQPQTIAALRAYLGRAQRSPDPAYRAHAERRLADSCRSYALLHNSTTPEQRARAVQRLRNYERDARELAAQKKMELATVQRLLVRAAR